MPLKHHNHNFMQLYTLDNEIHMYILHHTSSQNKQKPSHSQSKNLLIQLVKFTQIIKMD
jgi:hypothetical protein